MDENECIRCGWALHLNDGCEWPEDGPICYSCLLADRDRLAARVAELEGERDELQLEADLNRLLGINMYMIQMGWLATDRPEAQRTIEALARSHAEMYPDAGEDQP